MATPDMLVAVVRGHPGVRLGKAAQYAVMEARRAAPKLSGASARKFQPVHGPGWFGIHWVDAYVWYQNQGINPFTMRSLAGKTIPMWIDDPTGEEARKNPKAETRTTASGKRQVLIFRRAASMGSRRVVVRRFGSVRVPISVPASYPGAPGRIAVREAAAPLTTPGRTGGRIATGNVGVRWRHPGLQARRFLEQGIRLSATRYGLDVVKLYAREDGRLVEAA